MSIQKRIETFSTLGERLRNLPEALVDEWYFRATGFNNWFTRDSVSQSLKALGEMLRKESLDQWMENYTVEENTDKTVAIIMAGNIPLVGFHDLLSVLMAGHHALAKLSSQDPYLLKEIVNLLAAIDPELAKRITLTQNPVSGFDAVIATGSNNSARYFEQYFSKYPHIIRKNRSSIAILDGTETEEQIGALGNDIFQYYGLGCRNVSKIYVPVGYDFTPLIDQLQPFSPVADHHKWANNYDYNKSIYLVNNEPHLDSGFFLMRESKDLVSPISVIFYEFYENEAQLHQLLEDKREMIQCTVSGEKESIGFGKAQKPQLWDYADGVDTMKFLTTAV